MSYETDASDNYWDNRDEDRLAREANEALVKDNDKSKTEKNHETNPS